MTVINKIASVLLFIIFGFSVLIIGFFYFGENLIDEEAFEAKKQKMEAPEDTRPYSMVEQEDALIDSLASDSLASDSLASDSLASDSLASDSITEVVQVVPLIPQEPAEPVKVKFSFFEKLVYYKTDISLGWAYILVGITLLLALAFPLVYMFSNTQNMIRTLGILAAAAIVIGFAYLLSSDVPLYIPGFDGTDNSDPGVLRFVDTGIFTTYFLIGLALISILFSEVAKYFK